MQDNCYAVIEHFCLLSFGAMESFHMTHHYIFKPSPGFLSALLPKWGENEIIGGGLVCIHVQSMWQTRGVWGHVPPRNFPFIRHKLAESETVFTQT